MDGWIYFRILLWDIRVGVWRVCIQHAVCIKFNLASAFVLCDRSYTRMPTISLQIPRYDKIEVNEIFIHRCAPFEQRIQSFNLLYNIVEIKSYEACK